MNGGSIRPRAPRIRLVPAVLWIAALAPILAAANGSSQTTLEGPYLGQQPPGTTPRIFAPGFISTAAHEFSCSFTPDGREFFFTRRDPDRNVALIMVTRSLEGTWSEPEVVPFVQNRMSFEPRVTPDGRRLYFTWDMPVPGQVGPPMNVWYVDRSDGGWSEPVNPGPPLNPMRAMYVSLTLDGTLYTSDIATGPGTEGIAVTRLTDGEYGDLVRLGPPINVGAQDMYPYIAPDESYLIFSSRRQDSEGGLFVSFRLPDGAWSDPQQINLGMPAGLPVISPDGKYLFFTGGERGRSDIYWVNAQFLEKLRPGQAASADAFPRPDPS